MLREAFSERLKQAMRAKDTRTLSTVRMVLAGLKDRDIAARGTGNPEGIAEPEIQRMLQGMVKQRRESIALYRQGNRPELAQQEEEEIAVIKASCRSRWTMRRLPPRSRRPLPRPAPPGSRIWARSWACCASAMRG